MTTKRWLLVSGVLGTAAVAGFAALMTGEELGQSGDGTRDPDALQELEATLEQVHRAWNPRSKERVFAQAKGQAATLTPPLLSVLSRGQHARLREAIELAVALDVEDARPALVDLAHGGPEDLRPAAIEGAGRLEPWAVEEFLEFFGNPDPAVRKVAIEMAPQNAPDEVLPHVFELLLDPEEGVRDAALQAVPRYAPAGARRKLLELARNADGAGEAWVVDAVGRLDPARDSEEVLTEKLDSGDPSTRAAALTGLARKNGRRLEWPDRVWSLARGLNGDPVESARALFCLERTNSFSVPELRRELPFLQHPLPRFFAARCLVTAGEKQGVEVLLDLLAKVDPEGIGDDVEPESLAWAIRTLLGELSGTGPHADSDEWQLWFRELRGLRPRTLEASPGIL